MKRTPHVLSLLGLAATAFLAGQLSLETPGSSAVAQETQPPPGMSPEMMEMFEAATRLGTPGEAHELLAKFEGEWDARMSFTMGEDVPPMTFSGTVSRKLVLGGRWLEERVTMSGGMMQFEGRGFFGYDNAEQRYVMVWMDNQTTHAYTEYGYYDPESKIMHMSGQQRDPVSGRVAPVMGRMDLSKPGEQHYVGHTIGPDGKRFEMARGLFRKK